MKTIDRFLQELYDLDIQLWVEDNRLRCNGPEEVLTEGLSAEIRDRKAEIMAVLQQTRPVSAPLLPASRPGNLPLSFAQQRLWFLDQLEPNSPVYNMSAAIRMQGELHIEALQQSIRAIAQRHETLRTTFTTAEGQPVQVINPDVEMRLPLLDFSAFPPDKALEWINQTTQKPFNLQQGPLFRAELIRLQASEYILVLTLHHIIADAWSIGILVKELSRGYAAFSTGNPPALAPLPIQYADFALWQRQWLQGEALETQLAYWKKQLGGALPVLQLPTDRPRPRIQTFRGARQLFSIDSKQTAALKALSQQQGATLFMTLLTVFKVLLHRYSAQEDILVGSPIANRNRTEIEGLIGFFVNTLVLRTDLSGNPTFLELLQRLRQVTWEAYDRQDLPFEKLVEELQSDRDLSYSPLFQVKFMLEDASKLDLQLPGLNLEFLEPENPTAKLDLSLDFYETDSDLLGVFEYNTDLFEADTIARMVGHFQTLLTGILANPQQRLSQFPLLTPGEQQQILVEWNQTQTPYPEESFHQLFEAQVERTPDAIAVVFQHQHLTYRELNQRANQLAHYLQKQGVKPEIRVGICIERSLSMIIALLGVLKAGGAYLPLDPAYPADRLAFMLSDSQVPLLLTTESLVSQLPAHSAQLICLDTDWPTIAQEQDCNPESGITSDNLAYLIYTSGSTGTPKGVLVTHAGLGNLTADKIRTCQVKPHSRVLQFFSFGFDASIPEFVMSLGCGAALHLATPAELSPGPALTKLLREQAITHITLIPSALAVLSPDDFPALEMVLVGGEAPTAELIAQWSKGRLFINAYGPTETTVNASMVPYGDTLRPAANKQFYILDRYLQPVPVGVPGELCIGGVGLARGYLNRPEKTAAAFIANPFSQQPGSRLYKTGDLAYYRRDGQIKLLGRLDNQVKIRGFRIELGEIEALMLQHPDIRDCAVVVREAQPGDKRCCAYWVAEPGRNLTKGDLRRELEAKLPKYMVPTVFIQLEALPLNPNGKVDRQALPSPDFTRPELAGAFVAPRTPVEMQLAEIFAEVLKVERVGVNDDFFELGGHSLLVTQLISRLLQRFAVELAVLDLFEAPTVAGLAQRLSGKSPAKLDNLLAFLQAEAVLDASIIPPQTMADWQNPQGIFLTGATGFVGAFLLAELLQQTSAKICCLVRADNAEAAQRKLQATLESYQIWQEGFKTRIIPVVGDLAKPRFGLSESEFSAISDRIQVIYHNGAWVHHAYPYTLLKPTNVLGTQEVLRFACQGQAKPVHFLSATSVFSPTQASGVQVIQETDSLADFPAPLGGYNQSKWVAEGLMQQAQVRGLPIFTYRLGRIAGDSQTGCFNVNDFLYRLIIGCVQLGSVPIGEMMLDVLPVDYASKAIIYLSQHPTENRVFHLVHPQPVSSGVLFEQLRSLGYSIQSLPYEQWRAKLLQIAQSHPEHALYPLVPLFPPQTATSNPPALQFDCQNVQAGLAHSPIRCIPLDNCLWETYFKHLIEREFLPQPSVLNSSI